MRKRSLITAIAGAAAVAMTLTACSSGGSSSANPTSLEVFSYWTSGSENAALNSLVGNYEKDYPKIKVKLASVSGGGGANAQQVLQSRIAGGTAPDVWQTHPGKILATYTKDNLVEDLTPLFKKGGYSKVIPASVVESMKENGKVYTALTGVHRQNILWYNIPVAKRLGITVSPNMTMNEFMAAMQKAKSAGVTPLCNGDQQIFASAAIAENVIAAHVGADGLDQLADGKGWGSSDVAAAMKDYATVLENENTNHTALTWDQAVQQFGKGECLFNGMVDSAYGELLHDGFVDGKDFGYTTFPGTENMFIAIADSFVVNGKLGNKSAANDWIDEIQSPKAQLQFSKLKGSIPVRTDVDVSSLGKYQQVSAGDYKSKTIVNTMTFGQSLTPSQEQAFYDAITAFNTSKDVGTFVQSMKAAFNG